MTEFTPTTGMIREAYAFDCDDVQGALEEFDRWHAEEIRKAKEEAWEEGLEAYPVECGVPCGACELCMTPGPENPYRKEQND